MRSCRKTASEEKHPRASSSAVSNSQLCQWGHSKNFHMETPRPTEGFINKVTKISKHISTLSFSHELSGNIYSTIPSYLWNKAIFIYRRHTGGEKEPKKPSNWKDCSTNWTMKNTNIKQGAGVCLASRERWQTKDPALPKIYTHANKDSTKSSCIWKIENMTFLLFGGMNEKELKKFQLKGLRSMSLILRGMKMWLEGYLYFYQMFLHETIMLERSDLDFMLYFLLSRICGHLSKFIFHPYTSFIL